MLDLRKQLCVVGAAALLACAGCASVLPTQTGSAATSEGDLGVTSPQESDAPDLCKSSTLESIDLLNAAMDRMDRATTATEIDEASAPMGDLFNRAGVSMGENCGREDAGDAVSELIVWASSAASTRSWKSASFAEGFLESVCNLDEEAGIEFTPAAQIACAG